ncbi:MAG: DnaJ C-terminal domain-containing protein [bacterium]
MKKDYYRVLGVDKQATSADIKQAYRRLAKKYHPDVSKEPDAEVQFKLLNEAYEVLGDMQKKAHYDRQFKTTYQSSKSSTFHYRPAYRGDFDPEFHDFNSQPTENYYYKQQAPTDHQTEHHANTHSKTYYEEPNAQTQSNNSHNTHSNSMLDPQPIPPSWWKRSVWPLFKKKPKHRYAKITLALEDVIGGVKKRIRLPDNEQLYVMIPEGVEEGKKIRIAGKGFNGGDLFLTVHFKPHPLFHLEGRDIYSEINISPWEAALGATIVVPTLKGDIPMRLAPNTQTGTKLRLKGYGLLSKKTKGDQYVTVAIHIPLANTPEERAVYTVMQNRFKGWHPRQEQE